MLPINQVAPDFTLPVFGGGESHFYGKESKTGVLIFYKFSCPTCQLAIPFLQRIYDAYGNAFHFVAVAQDGPEETAKFRQEYGITIPTLMDMTPYPFSRRYDIAYVPSIFLVNQDHTIRFSGEGFVKQEMLNLADALAERSGRPQIDVFGDDEVPEIKPG